MSMKRWSGRVVLAAMVLVLAAPALAQSADLKSLIDRMARLERDIRTLNVRLARGGEVPASAAGAGEAAPSAMESAVARLEVRLTELENELRAATGRAEELSHHMSGLNQRLDKLIADMDYRLGVLEQAGTAAPGAAPAAPPAVQSAAPAAAAGVPPGVLGTITQSELDRVRGEQAGPPGAAPPTTAAAEPAPTESPAAVASVLPDAPPETQYAHAFGLLRQTRYDDAEVALAEFVRANPDHKLAGNARYWLGETYYVRNDYARAAEVFLDGYQKEPKGPKAADALLKLGMSLLSLEKAREACAAFDKLARDLPDAPSNIVRTMERQRKRAGCP